MLWETDLVDASENEYKWFVMSLSHRGSPCVTPGDNQSVLALQ